MCAEQDVAAFLESEALVDVGGLDLGKVLGEDFGHG